MSREIIVREVLTEGLDDWVPVDRVIGLARESQDAQGEDFKVVSVNVIESLLQQGLMSVGEIGNVGFEAWTGDVNDILTRVIKELDKVNWMPFGGVCWLANTPIGDSLASSWS